jgi:hypothetical protein
MFALYSRNDRWKYFHYLAPTGKCKDELTSGDTIPFEEFERINKRTNNLKDPEYLFLLGVSFKNSCCF